MRRQIQRVELICSVFFVAICADFGGAKWLRRFILLSFFSSLVPWRFLQLKIIFKAKMVRNSASRTVLRKLTRLTSKWFEVMVNILIGASLYFQTVRFLNFRILNNSSFFLFIPPLFNLYYFKGSTFNSMRTSGSSFLPDHNFLSMQRYNRPWKMFPLSSRALSAGKNIFFKRTKGKQFLSLS